jgi:hypothetical protein
MAGVAVTHIKRCPAVRAKADSHLNAEVTALLGSAAPITNHPSPITPEPSPLPPPALGNKLIATVGDWTNPANPWKREMISMKTSTVASELA